MLDLQQIDLGLLMASNSFTFIYTLRKDRIAIQAEALSDTRASSFVFLDLQFVLDFYCIFNLKPKRLP